MNAKRKRDKELEEQKKRHEQAKADKLQKIQEHEKALFDFDEEIDHLQEVDERYPGMPLEEDGQVNIHKIEDDNKMEENTREDVEEKKDEPEIVQPPKSKFVSQVKRAVRPNLPEGILKDIEKMK